MLSATPLNNYFTDILSLLKLFQRPNRSNIPGIRNLNNFFKPLQKKVKDASKEEYIKVVKYCSTKIREGIFKHVMIRRTRNEIKKYFSKDISKQGLSFPEVAPPIAVGYEFSEKIDKIFHETIDLIKNNFSKARYTPYLYLKKKKSDFENARQINIGGFMKTMLVKRLESSFHAFKLSINRFIKSHEDFIEMYNTGVVYVSKKINVYELMDEDDQEKIDSLISEGLIEKYESSEFNEKFKEQLLNDTQCLRIIFEKWKDIREDPKINKLIKELKNNNQLSTQKIVMFTESKETGEYLLENLSNVYGEKVFFYSSEGGRFFLNNELKKLGIKESRTFIKENFDPNQKEEEKLDNLKILISTDVLAEGINLHRSNIEINYDLPWNPTRVIQRTGRVNRVGSTFKEIFIFNFFPTKESESEIGQTRNIKTKLQAIHDCLGSDSKFLSENEEVKTYGLFGDTLYNKLNDKKFYEGDESDETEFKYLQIIREIRDNNKELFLKIKELVKKARTAMKSNDNLKESLLTFFRKGKLKKFIISQNSEPREITFLEAANLLECDVNEEKQPIPKNFFSQLKENKKCFDEILKQPEDENISKGGMSKERELVKTLKSYENEDTFNEEHNILLRKLIRAFQDGIIARKTIKKIHDEIFSPKEKEPAPIKILSIFKSYISNKYLDESIDNELTVGAKREVVLSEFFYKNG